MQNHEHIFFPTQARLRRLSTQETIEAPIPSTVHDAWADAGKIPDPFFRLNEKDLQWIEAEDWEYSFDLEIPEANWSPSADMVRDLCFLGLDTYAEIRVNGSMAGEVANMFHAHEFRNPQGLKAGKNTIAIRFKSPQKADIPKARALGYALPSVNEQSEVAGLGSLKIAPFARKSPYQYGWDWGPRFVTMGMWRSGYLRLWNRARLMDSHLCTRELGTLSEDSSGNLSCPWARIEAVSHIEAAKDGNYLVSCSLNGQELGKKRVFLRSGEHMVAQEFKVENPRLWWCNGMGNPELCTFETRLLWVGDGEPEVLDTKTQRTGIRTLELVREKDDWGKSFKFRINGLDVFARGANYIPNHSFLPKVGLETYRHILGSAKDAHMNMLRVWGGGIYENPEFYELCDQYGIMVWQDFMFACAMYPLEEAFLDRVKIEARLVVQRLRRHPSLALWCGNNEIDSAWRWDAKGKGWGFKENLPAQAAEDLNTAYDRIFHHILPDMVRQEDPERTYWPSSPQADWYKSAEYDSQEGDMHYWGVWHKNEPFEEYQKVIPRFMSEYGFQSFPEPSSIRRFAQLPEDAGFDSPVMQAHQRSFIGNGAIKKYMERYLKVPSDFDDFILASHILQAEAIRSAIIAHRTNKPRCMGSLFWQLNDCWPAASWSSIDFYGRWKALHFHARRVYQPILLTLRQPTPGTIQIMADNDGPAQVGGRLIVHLCSTDGTIQARREFPALLPRDCIYEGPILELAELALDLKAKDMAFLLQFDQDNGPLTENHAFLTSTRDLGLGDPGLAWEILDPTRQDSVPPEETHSDQTRYLSGYNLQTPEHTFILKVTSRACARFVHIGLDPDHPLAAEVWPEDDWFDMMPKDVRLIRIHSALGKADLAAHLKLRSAWDICGLG